MVEISKLGVIGNCQSSALISNEGELVWLCLPYFDSPSIFAKILDEDKGGSLAIIPEKETVISQSYLEQTNILKTVFDAPSGKFEILDFMPIYNKNDSYETHKAPEIYRFIKVISGEPLIKIAYQPKLSYAQYQTDSFISEENIKSVTKNGEYHSIYLYSNLPMLKILNNSTIKLKQDAYLLVSYHQKLIDLNVNTVQLELEKTKTYWQAWVKRTKKFAKYNKEIIRSALVLKLLNFQKTGAVIAATTTSIPESIGEVRNWDYRYCWVRDASMIIDTLWQINHKKTAKGFLQFLLSTMVRKADTLQILYGIHGEKKIKERKLKNLSGYKNSKPVRIGNAAYLQKQNDIYGVLMDLIYTYFIHFSAPLNEIEELWTTVRYIMKVVENNWHKTDRSIWEIRKQSRHYVFSKVLMWVAADRGVKIAQLCKKTEYIEKWTEIRDAIKLDIEEKAWNPQKNAYTQYYGSSDIDASLLLMEKVGYCQIDSQRYVSTVNSIYKELCVDGLMYRYKNKDDFGKPKSAFLVCSFWMVDSLYKIGQKSLAIDIFEKLLKIANPLGLYSEDVDFDSYELLGNFPQGYSHLALINSAIMLNER